MLKTSYGAYRAQFLSPLDSPCTARPWGLIAGVDLVSGKLLWSKPCGAGRDIGPLKLGVKTMLPITISTPSALDLVGHLNDKWMQRADNSASFTH